MPTRGFYRLAKADIPRLPDGSFPDPSNYGTYVLRVGATYVYLHSETYPNERIEALGAQGVGGTWREIWQKLPDGVRNRIFRAIVRRIESVDGEERQVTRAVVRAEIMASDTVLTDKLPYHKWAGDPNPLPVEE